MDNDPCSASVQWSAIAAAGLDSTVAGVLAGLLIAAVAALLSQWSHGLELWLFCSGVPVLAFSAYLFSVIAATRTGDTRCPQLWSEWVLAIGALFIGTAVLICGLGWVLISYADDQAVGLVQRNIMINVVARQRGIFIRLNAWLSVAVITVAGVLLIVANVTYLTATGQQAMHSEIFGENWYLLFFVYLFGLYLIARASYVIFSRTSSALRANRKSCAAYAAGWGGPPVATDNEGIRARVGPVRPAKDPSFARLKKVAMRVAREFAVAILVALGALLAVYMTSGEAFNERRKGIAVSPHIVIYVVVLYIIVRAIYVLITYIAERASPPVKEDTLTNNETILPENVKSAERIRINFTTSGGLSTTIYSVVLLAILGSLFVVALTQGQLWTVPRIIISLFLGGLYPAVILAGLSASVPAAEDVRRPKWEMLHWLMVR